VQPRNQGYLHQDTIGPSHTHIGLGDCSGLDTRIPLLSAEIIFKHVEKWKISCLKYVEKWGILKFESGGNCLVGPARLSPTPALIYYYYSSEA